MSQSTLDGQCLGGALLGHVSLAKRMDFTAAAVFIEDLASEAISVEMMMKTGSLFLLI